MLILKIGVTLIVVALLCMMWFVVGSMIYEVIWEHKCGIYDGGSIFLTIFYTLIVSGVTLVVVYGLSLLYIGG